MRLVQLALCKCTLLLLAVVAEGAPSFRIETLGLNDEEHARSNGSINSSSSGMTETGQSYGTSLRLGTSGTGQSAWHFDGSETIKIGLTGPGYESSAGYKFSTTVGMNQLGQVIGTSYRYNGQSLHGHSVWIYDGENTIPLGLVDAEHTRTDGYTSSSVLKIADGPYVTGYSQRYNDNLSLGRTAWLYGGATTQVIGLVDADHTRSDGYRESTTFAALNASGYVAGTSRRYVSPSTTGESVWLYDGVETKNVGLIDSEHSRSDGYQHSFIANLNANGQVAGQSYRFEDMEVKGRSAWIYDGNETHVVGLRGSGYTSPDNFQDSSVKDLNNRGEAVGSSTRFGGDIGLGTSAWFFDGENSTEIGLVDAEHTKNDGVRIASINGLSEVGRAFGSSQRYEGTSSLGYSTWVYDGQSTTKIGLIDSQHTAPNGYRDSSLYLFSDSGNAIGHSRGFNGSGDFFGSSAWLYNGSETILLAPSGPEYLGNDDYRVTTASRLTNSGFVGGTAARVGEGYSGEDAWVFNPNTQQTTSIVLSTRSDGYSRSHVQYLSEEGVALGTYALYDENDVLIGDRIFYFSPGEGAFDLESLVRGGLSAAGWEYLQGHQRTSVVIANEAGLITGAGRRLPLGTDRTAYLLVPLSGDFDGDGDVDGRDLLAWQRGESPEPFSAEDLALWQSQIGNINALSANVVVPEPSVARLLLMSICAIGFHHSSRRNSYFPASAGGRAFQLSAGIAEKGEGVKLKKKY